MAIRDALRYLVASAMLLAGTAGLAAGGGWNWLGVVTFVLVLLLDVSLPRDEASRSADTNRLGDLVLYLPLPLIAALWLLFAHHLASVPSFGVNTVGAVVLRRRPRSLPALYRDDGDFFSRSWGI